MATSNNGDISKDAVCTDGTWAFKKSEVISIADLEQEQPMEQEDQVHLTDLESEEPKKSGSGESESDSDPENAHHGNGKFKNERTGVISLTPTTARDSIPDKLEINKEQAAQLKQFLPDKSHKGRGRARGQGRPSAHSRLGVRPGMGLQQNPQMVLGQFLQGVLGQQPRGSFPFSGSPPNRGPFPTGLLNPPGPFPVRHFNRGPFPGGPQNQRPPFPVGSGNQRGLLPLGSLNLPHTAPQRGPALRPSQGRFPGPSNQGGLFGVPQPPRMPAGPQPIRGLPPNQLRFQNFPNQRVVNPGQFGQKPPLLGQQGLRLPLQNPGIGGPRQLLGNAGPGMRFARPGVSQHGQSIPSLVNQVANALKSSLAFQPLRPGQGNSLTPNMNNRPPGLMQNLNRFQPPVGQPQGPARFMTRGPVPSGPFGNTPMFRSIRQPLLGGQGGIFPNRFQGPQNAFGMTNMGRPFRMGMPVQQRKAKALLEKAKHNQNKHTITTPMKLTGAKRKSTGGDDVPTKVVRPEENNPAEIEIPCEIIDTPSSDTIVQAGSGEC